MSVRELCPNEKARHLLKEARQAASDGDEEEAVVLWKRAQDEAREGDCGGMFLSSAHLALVYQSWGSSHEDSKKEAVGCALSACQRAFVTDTPTLEEIKVPPQVVKILKCLAKISPEMFKERPLIKYCVESSELFKTETKIEYTRSDILQIAGPRITNCADDEDILKMLAETSYQNISIKVDVHPDNLLPPAHKRNGGKQTSKKKKKRHCSEVDLKYKITEDEAKPLTNVHVCSGIGEEDHNKSSELNWSKNSSHLTSEQALEWANSLESSLNSVLGDGCVLLVDSHSDSDVKRLSGSSTRADEGNAEK